jgi:2-oxoglutarate dehydrogenase E1 component
MLLPHGFEGQGPEHSSARLERYLQLCAEDNIQVANCTTPAQYFHILRRQMLRDFRKPLIMMTPKSLLRHKLVVSKRADFIGEGHFHRILSDLNPPAAGETRRVVLCSGKLSYELMEVRDTAGDTATEIIRIEQLYPFPGEPLVKRLKAMPKLEELVWAQEEPKNNGAWHFVEDELEECLTEAGFAGKRARYAGRAASASPATGLAKRHAAEQAALIADALGHSSRSAATKQAS